MPRRKTEERVLQKLAAGQPLTTKELDDLTKKIGKGQSRKKAREITKSTEARYAAQIASMPAGDQQTVARAISDYTNSSTVINTNCRAGVVDHMITNIDNAFAAFSRINADRTRRITYRLTTYKPGDHMPYGAPVAGPGPRITVGDYIRDDAYVSASENRQLLVSGVNNPAAGTRYVKFSIVGIGGINISGGSAYNNQQGVALLKYYYPKTWRVRTAQAGQAEILYARGTIFRVQKITPVGRDVKVVVNIPDPQPGGMNTKNSFTGA
ncbi:hypothetical protein OT109_05490 [Phycisphaeraceae bacterium D3-23]